MDGVVLVFDFGEVVEIELSEEGAVVAVAEVFGQEGAAEFVGLMDNERGVAGGPANEALVLGLTEDEGKFEDEGGGLVIAFRFILKHYI